MRCQHCFSLFCGQSAYVQEKRIHWGGDLLEKKISAGKNLAPFAGLVRRYRPRHPCMRTRSTPGKNQSYLALSGAGRDLFRRGISAIPGGHFPYRGYPFPYRGLCKVFSFPDLCICFPVARAFSNHRRICDPGQIDSPCKRQPPPLWDSCASPICRRVFIGSQETPAAATEPSTNPARF